MTVVVPYMGFCLVEGVEVVTAVTEAVLSFSGARVRLDVDTYIGDEGSPVKREKRTVGFVTASEYGSRSLSVGGVSLLKGPHGFNVAPSPAEAQLLHNRFGETGTHPKHRYVAELVSRRNFPILVEGPVDKGYSDEVIQKVLGENLMRVFASVWGG